MDIYVANMKNVQIKVGVLIIQGQNVLLIKEWSESNKKYLWNTIKGTHNTDDLRETVFDTASRECEEEAGVAVKLTALLNCTIIDKKKEGVRVQFNFLISGTPKIANRNKQIKRNENIIEVRWFGKKEILKLKRNHFISQLAFFAIRDWQKRERYPLKVIRYYF